MLLSYLIKDLIRIALICLLFSIVEKRVRQLLQTCKRINNPNSTLKSFQGVEMVCGFYRDCQKLALRNFVSYIHPVP
jgi:hypothetical protein